MSINIDFNKINKIFQSKIFKWVLIVIGVLAILLLVFRAGMMVGFRKANFSYRWGENYHRNFGGPREGFLGGFIRNDFMGKDFIVSHGVFGEIIELTKVGLDNALVIKGRGDMEKIILISEKTAVEKGRDTIKKEELKVGDRVVVIGSPNEQGQIEAKLIRIFK